MVKLMVNCVQEMETLATVAAADLTPLQTLTETLLSTFRVHIPFVLYQT